MRCLCFLVAAVFAQGAFGEAFPSAVFAEADSAAVRLEGRASDSVLELEGGEGVVLEGGRITSDTVWKCDDVHVVRNEIVVPSGVTLTVEGGTVLKFLPETGVRVENGGTLVLAGDEDAEIVLTSVSDDTVGGDTDGKAVAPVFGNYRIYVVSGGTLTDTHAQFRYGRSETFPTATVPGKAVTRHDCGIVRIPILVSGTRTTPFSVDWVAEDGAAKLGTDYQLASGRIEWNASSEGWKVIEIPLNRLASLESNMRFVVHLVQGGGINLDPDAVSCDVIFYETNPTTLAQGKIGKTFPDAAFAEADSAAIRLEGRVASSDLELEGGEGVVLEGGRITSDTVWKCDNVHVVRNEIVVPSGVTLTVEGGTVLKFLPETGIRVEYGGTLVLAGNEGAEIVLTSVSDDTVGGDTDGRAVAPVFGNYRIYVVSGGTLTDTHAQFRYGRSEAFPTATVPARALGRHDDGVVRIPVLVSGTRTTPFSVDWIAEVGTAKQDEDYRLASGRIEWNSSSEGWKVIEIPLNRFAERKANARFTVHLKQGGGINLDPSAVTCDVILYETNPTTTGDNAPRAQSDWSARISVDSWVALRWMPFLGEERISYSSQWNGGGDPVEVVDLDPLGKTNVLQSFTAPCEGAFAWLPDGLEEGRHLLSCGTNEMLFVLNRDLAVHDGVLTADEIWSQDKVHLVRSPVTVPSGVSLTISPNAIVKFMPGTGIDVDEGGLGVGMGAVFTHAHDDTIGGDTFFDGDATVPTDGEYALTGDWEYDETTQFRYEMPIEAGGTMKGANRWQGYKTYKVTSNLVLANGATLDIDSGAIVKFGEGLSLTVNSGATLNVRGRRTSPVVFTSIRDDVHGGDTNRDGDNTSPRAGDWSTIAVNGGTANFEYAQILYSSKNNTTGAISMNGGKVSFVDGLIAHGLHDAVGVESGSFAMTNSVIVDCLQAFRHWAKDPIVNCVVYDCGRLTQGGGQHFVNCVFSKITETWEAFSLHYNGTTYTNCCFWNEGGSVLTAEGTQDALDICGKDGNIWGDPLFVNPDAFDFRIVSDSPCVNAGDSTVAPALDHYGQPRIGAADIGIHEWVPRGTASEVDCAVAGVTAPAAVVVGDKVTVSWGVLNIGSGQANGRRTDEISFVDADGIEHAVASASFREFVAAGGSAVHALTFRMPSAAEGIGRFRVNVNAHRDIFEGTLTGNNVGAAESSTLVSIPLLVCGEKVVELDPGQSGYLKVGSGVTTVSIANPSQGIRAFFSLKNPQTGGESVVEGVMAGGSLVLSLPNALSAGTVVTLTVMNNSGTAVAVRLNAGQTTLSAASSSTSRISKDADSTVTIYGTGLDGVRSARLVGVGSVATEILSATPNMLVLKVPCIGLDAGSYKVELTSEGGVCEMESGVEVYTSKVGPVLDVKLDMATEVRDGRRYTGVIRYGNTGDTPMAAPCLMLEGSTPCGLRFWGEGELNRLFFFATGKGAMSAYLQPGEWNERSFSFSIGKNTEFCVRKVELLAGVPVSMDAAFEERIERIQQRGGDIYDLCSVKCADISPSVCGTLTVRNGKADEVEVAVFGDDGNVVSSASLEADGRFEVNGLEHGVGYTFRTISGAVMRQPFSFVMPTKGDLTGVALTAYAYRTLSVGLSGLPDGTVAEGDYCLYYGGQQIASGAFAEQPFDVQFASTGADAVLTIEVTTSSGLTASSAEIVARNDGTRDEVTVDFAGMAYVECTCSTAGGEAVDADVTVEDQLTGESFAAQRNKDGLYVVSGLPNGSYRAYASSECCRETASVSFDVTESGKIPVSLVLGETYGGTVSGSVADLADVDYVVAECSDLDVCQMAMPDADGTFRMRGLASGTYRVMAMSLERGLAVAACRSLFVPDEGQVVASLSPLTSVRVSGQLRDPDGSPLGGRVIFDSSFGESRILDVGQDGAFSVVLHQGEFRISAQSSGHVDDSGFVSLTENVSLTLTLRRGAVLSARAPDGFWRTDSGVRAAVLADGAFADSCEFFDPSNVVSSVLAADVGACSLALSSPSGFVFSDQTLLKAGTTNVVPLASGSRKLSASFVPAPDSLASVVAGMEVVLRDGTGLTSFRSVDMGTSVDFVGLPSNVPLRVLAKGYGGDVLGWRDVDEDANAVSIPVCGTMRLDCTDSSARGGQTVEFVDGSGVVLASRDVVRRGTSFSLFDIPADFTGVVLRDGAGGMVCVSRASFESSGCDVCPHAYGLSTVTVTVGREGDKGCLFGVHVAVFDADSNMVEKVTGSDGTAVFSLVGGHYRIVFGDVGETDEMPLEVSGDTSVSHGLPYADDRTAAWVEIKASPKQLSTKLASAPRGFWEGLFDDIGKFFMQFSPENFRDHFAALGEICAIYKMPSQYAKQLEEFDRRIDALTMPEPPCKSDYNVNLWKKYLKGKARFQEMYSRTQNDYNAYLEAVQNLVSWGVGLGANAFSGVGALLYNLAVAVFELYEQNEWGNGASVVEGTCSVAGVGTSYGYDVATENYLKEYWKDAAVASGHGEYESLCNDVKNLNKKVDVYNRQKVSLQNRISAVDSEIEVLTRQMTLEASGSSEFIALSDAIRGRQSVRSGLQSALRLTEDSLSRSKSALQTAKSSLDACKRAISSWLKTNIKSMHRVFSPKTLEKLFGILGNMLTALDLKGRLKKYYDAAYRLTYTDFNELELILHLIQRTANTPYADCTDDVKAGPPLVSKQTRVMKSEDPNEIVGEEGRSEKRLVGPGEVLSFTVYFENKSTADVAAQEIRIENPLDAALDWSSLSVSEVVFRNQTDTGLAGKNRGVSEVALKDTSYHVRTEMSLDESRGVANWYIRIFDRTTVDGWPKDVFAGVLPPNDAAHNGEGHITYSIRVRDDVPYGTVVQNAATIVFDTNASIPTDPSWWNTLAASTLLQSGTLRMTALVDPDWMRAKVGSSATAEQRSSALDAVAKNGLKTWQCLALGLDPEDADDQFLVDVPQNDDPETVAVRAAFGQTVGCWVPAVRFRLDDGASQDSSEFGIDIGGETDPTGIYQVKAVFADDEGNDFAEVPAANQIGILRKTAANKREIVPVPWTKFAAGAEDIAVSNLVKTAGLTAGDKLYVYDDSAKRYATWELQSDKTWKPVKTVKMVNGKLEVQTADSPEVATVKRGSGVWLERHDLNTPITLVGQHEATLSEIEIAQGTTEAPNWNLVANPAISNWNLNAICEGVAVTDRIIVPTGGEPRIYTRDDANARWGYIRNDVFKNSTGIEIVRPTRVEDDVEIPAGTGFWYVSEGGSPVIKW